MATADTAGAQGPPPDPATSPAPAATPAPISAPSPTPATKPLINLLRGWPAPSLLPATQLSDAASRVLLNPTVAVPSLQYGADPGYQPLRESLADYLGSIFRKDAAPDADRICISGGASQNMACVLQSFTDPAYTARIWVVAPCYYLMCPIFEDAGFAGRLRAVPEDNEGMDVVALERGLQEFVPTAADAVVYKPHLAPIRKAYRHVVYVVPASSNPSGRTMTLARRQALVRLARKYDALVVADDVYDLLQWPVGGDREENSNGDVPLPPPLPRLVDVDRTLPHDAADNTDSDGHGAPFGHAISNGSFSKLVGPGLRTGWVEAAPAFVYGLSQTGSTRSGGAPSQLCAAVADDLLRTGVLDRHLRAVVRPTLQRRHRRLTAALAAQRLDTWVEVVGAPAASASSPTFGGYFLWLRLRIPGMRATDVAARAKAAENLVVAPGTLFQVLGDEAAVPFDDHLRLSFSWEDDDRLEEGVARLARVLRSWEGGTEILDS